VAGGIGAAVATLARGMVRAGHRVSVMGVYPEAAIEDDHGVAVYRLALPRRPLGIRGLNWYLMRRKLRAHVARLHAREPIDVVEWPDYQGTFWRPIRGIVDVVKVHGTALSHRRHGLGGRIPWTTAILEMRTLRKIRNWVGVSEWFNAEWRQVANVKPDREVIVYNPVDTGLFAPVQPEKRRKGLVFYSGALRARKGVKALIQAADIFLQEVPHARLVLMGYESDLKKQDLLALAPRVADRIEFMPFADQRKVAEFMAAAEVFAMPSLYESCGNGWVEAMSCGVPAIGSTWSCGPEIVADGETGFLADPAQPQDIAEKIIRLLTDPALAGRMGAAGRQRALERFSIDVGVKRSEEFYRQCIEDRRSR
jgi:glycosyltransferase involved in cell wall biosynthesis